jgi:uroporphyrinogen-III synthase
MIPLLVTRAAADAAALAARLGPHAIVAPCLAYADTDAPRPAVSIADLLVASPRAVAPLARAGLLPGWRVLALAPATAAALRAADLRVDLAIDGGGEALARAAAPGPVLLATSDLGGDEVLRVRPDAIRWVVYRTVCPDLLPREAVAAMAGPFDVLFASPSAVRHFARLAPGAILHARRVLCHGATTLTELRRFGRAGEPFDLAHPGPAPASRPR